jgi:hypothetical protein
VVDNDMTEIDVRYDTNFNTEELPIPEKNDEGEDKQNLFILDD